MGTLQGRYVIAGGSGFLGTSLAAHLTGQGASVVVLTRRRDPGTRPWAQAVWVPGRRGTGRACSTGPRA
jgi:uncharacterized protein YbjT (DUF2867 family)